MLDLLFPTRPDAIEPGDLWAAGSHGAEADPEAAVALLLPGPTRTNVHRHLRRLADQPPLTDALPGTLDAMWDLHQAVDEAHRGARRDAGRPVPRCQIAHVLCALKCPSHFPLPVAGAPWSNDTVGVGRTKLEVFSHRVYAAAVAVTDPALRQLLAEARRRMGGDGRAAAETQGAALAAASDLRLLSALLSQWPTDTGREQHLDHQANLEQP